MEKDTENDVINPKKKNIFWELFITFFKIGAFTVGGGYAIDVQKRQDADFIKDYMEAIATYKKIFPTRNEVIEKTPDPAIKDMLEYEKEQGIENIFEDVYKRQVLFHVMVVRALLVLPA